MLKYIKKDAIVRLYPFFIYGILLYGKRGLMKKFLLVFGLILVGSLSYASSAINIEMYSSDEVTLVNDVSISNFWKKKGLSQEKVLSVGQKILVDNKIDKRVPINVPSKKQTKIINHNFLYLDK